MTLLKRRDFLKMGLAASSLLGLGNGTDLIAKFGGRAETRVKILVIGFDGLDPHLVEIFMEQGKMPSFSRLAGQGGFSRLRTSIPPQSPVAWSNFITGTDPGGHGIFDFMHRDPKKYIPIFSGTESTGPKSTLRIGKWALPVKGGTVRNLRRGRAFWQVLEEHDIPSVIFKMPANYPPAETRQKTLSGMGTPDLKGSYGIFSFYTNDPRIPKGEVSGGRVQEAFVIGNRVEARLSGPANTYLREPEEAGIDFRVSIDPENPVAKISIQDQEFILKEKEWSGWKRVRFPLIPTQSVSGICLFYLKEVRPYFKLYASPINVDPSDPALPLSTPESYAAELAKRFGPFFTKGLPADTSALDNDVLDEQEFLEQDDRVLSESKEMFDYELGRFSSGLLFYYISSTDQRQHMFWRLLDPSHPSYDPLLASKFGGAIENIYIEADRILAGAMERADKDTLLLVMSDHGFNPFRRAFNLNTWLVEAGYHKLINPWKQDQGELFQNTDWPKTLAYNIGLNGLYINQRGRELEGPVEPGAASDALIREIAGKLERAVDPKTGERAIARAYVAKDVYRGPYAADAPDIVLGFNRGYRISFGSPLGRFPKEVFEDNTEKWSGDHMGAAEILPGILFSNRPMRSESPALYDLTATILDLFGIEAQPGMIGRPIF